MSSQIFDMELIYDFCKHVHLVVEYKFMQFNNIAFIWWIHHGLIRNNQFVKSYEKMNEFFYGEGEIENN